MSPSPQQQPTPPIAPPAPVVSPESSAPAGDAPSRTVHQPTLFESLDIFVLSGTLRGPSPEALAEPAGCLAELAKTLLRVVLVPVVLLRRFLLLVCVVLALVTVGGFTAIWEVPTLADRNGLPAFDVARAVLAGGRQGSLQHLPECRRAVAAASGREEAGLAPATADELRLGRERVLQLYPGMQPWRWQTQNSMPYPYRPEPIGTPYGGWPAHVYELHWPPPPPDDRPPAGAPTMSPPPPSMWFPPSAHPLEPRVDLVWWAAWQRLESGNPHLAGDLARLAPPNGGDGSLPLRRSPLLKERWPDEAGRSAAIAWAETFRERLTLRQPGSSDLPPDGDATTAWLLYQHVGLTPESQAFARRRWEAWFPGRVAEAEAWGRSRETQRRAAGEPLPPSDELTGLLCAVEAMLGTDAHGQDCHRVAQELLARRSAPTLRTAILFAWPDDEPQHWLAAGDPGDFQSGLPTATIFETRGPVWNLLRPLHEGPVRMLVTLPLLAVGLRALVFAGVAPLGLLLFRRRHPAYAAFRAAQYRWTRSAVLVTMAAPIALWAWMTWGQPPAPPAGLMLGSPWRLLLAAVLSTVAGGLVALTINRLAGLVFLRCGYDLDRTLWDEVLGSAAGVAVLWHFGQSGPAMVASMAMAVLPELLRRRGSNAPPPHVESSEAVDRGDNVAIGAVPRLQGVRGSNAPPTCVESSEAVDRGDNVAIGAVPRLQGVRGSNAPPTRVESSEAVDRGDNVAIGAVPRLLGVRGSDAPPTAVVLVLLLWAAVLVAGTAWGAASLLDAAWRGRGTTGTDAPIG